MARLQDDVDMIQRMEVDLASKAQAAFVTAGVSPNVHGVYSLDDLETKVDSDLCAKIAVGVGYAGAEPAGQESSQMNMAPGGGAAAQARFVFAVILAVPKNADCTERYTATKLLTVLRRGILGKSIDGDTTNRTWVFVKEFPNITESTDSMSFYSQVWRVAIPVSNKP